MPTQPAFNGDTSLFGVVSTVLVRPHAPRAQLDAYPGINGRTALLLGTDGGRTTADVLYANRDEMSLSILERDVINLAAQGPANIGILLDSQGREWAGVFLADARPMERVHYDGYTYSRKWQLVFEHLV